MQPGMSKAAYHVVAVDALDIGGHLIDPVPDKLPGGRPLLISYRSVVWGSFCSAGILSHVLPGKASAAYTQAKR